MAEPDRLGRGKRHTIGHRGGPQAILHGRFHFGQSGPRIDAHHFDGVVGFHHRTAPTTRPCDLDNVGQIIFAFGVVVTDRFQQIEQPFAVDRHNAAITQANLALRRIGVFCLDDGLETAMGRRNQSAIVTGIIGPEAKHHDGRIGRLASRGHHSLHRRRGEQGRIGEHHQNIALEPVQRIPRRQDRMAGAERWILDNRFRRGDKFRHRGHTR